MISTQKTDINRAPKAFIALGLAVAVFSSLPAAVTAHSTSSHTRSAQEAKERLKEIERKRQEAHERLRLAREKERVALQKLHKIQSALHSTTKVLNSNKHQLAKTETNLVQTETKLRTTTTQEHSMEGQASQRLREMYEGQRLGLLDMLFQVNSLQQLMDLLYYQERVAELDKKLISDLRAKATALSAQKSKLGQQKMQLGDIVSEFAKKALMLNKEKSEQEVVADKLRSQRAFYEAAEHQLSRESNQLEQQILQMVRASQSKSDKVVTHGSGSLAMPIHAPVTSPFGWRRHPIFGVRKFHTGVDLAGPNHTPVKASDSGNVLYSGWYGGYGKVVIVSHGNGLATLYAHMSKVNASAGQNVSKGDVVGYEGSTGFSTGPHLHFEVRVDGKPNNPLNYVR
ncbi:MAG: peptidoglycan DD-metalloendopeptidase family protein [Candidatus Obscuribacterales bacterium]|nr:peptidoglycan DD-metalloendopeptidase family protein [Candidatus Obscuribacterales bacterium]